MRMVIASTLGFLLTLTANAALAFFFALRGEGPALPHGIDQEMLISATWGFLIPAVWGFNARWLPVFLGLEAPGPIGLFTALGLAWGIVIAALTGYLAISVALMPIAAATSIGALHVWEPSLLPAENGRYSIRSLPVICAWGVWMAGGCLLAFGVCLYLGPAWRHLGRVTPCAHRGLSVHDGLLQSASEFCPRFAG